MGRPNILRVEATIPKASNPDAHVLVTETQGKPTIDTEIHTSVETALHTLGAKVIAGHLSIDRLVRRQDFQSHPHDNQPVNEAVVVTKPLDHSEITLATGYRWSDEPLETEDSKQAHYYDI